MTFVFFVKKITISWAHDKKRAKIRKKETRLCVRRTVDNIITHSEKKSYKKSVKKFGTFSGNCGILYLYIRFIEKQIFFIEERMVKV